MIKILILISSFLINISYAIEANPNRQLQLLQVADKLYSERADFEKAKKSLYLFQEFNKEFPSDVEGLWRLSMAYYYVGHLLEGKKNRFTRKEHYNKGLIAGKQCEKFSEKPKVECLFWQATNLALLEQEKGIFSLAFSLEDIIDLLEKAKDTDALYASAGAYRTLSILYSKAPGFLGGDNTKAREYIKKAITLAPNEPLNFVFYAKFLINEDNKAKAIQIISNFIKKADPVHFPFYESKNAYQELNYFLKHEEWPN